MIVGLYLMPEKRNDQLESSPHIRCWPVQYCLAPLVQESRKQYLPPTMSPCETSDEEGFLEYPSEAFSYYRAHGVSKVVCEEKHMGSRAVVIACRDEQAAKERFGIVGEAGVVPTRTGRRFFTDAELEVAFLARFRAAIDASGFWTRFDTGWACLDCELMPWSAKALESEPVDPRL
jgi:protein phosphatase